jgi:cellulose biosynthesis protein BcsQ
MSEKLDTGILGDGEGSKDALTNRDVAALFSNLQLNPEQYQAFSRRRPATIAQKTADIPRHGIPLLPRHEVPLSPKREIPLLSRHANDGATVLHIGVFSPMGGAGTSTLAVSVGSILCEMGRRILLVDTSQWQALAFHFGANELVSGVRTFVAPHPRDLRILILACDENALQSLDLDSFAATKPVDCVVFDLGRLSGDALNLCLRQCDALFVPMAPDPSAVRLANAVMLLLGDLGTTAPRVTFVLNKMDDSSNAGDVQALLSHELGPHLFPSVILQQVEVHDAVAVGVALPFYAPEAQASSVCHELVQWLQLQRANLVGQALRWSEE